MSSIYLADHISLDGIIQGPGRADEDTRDGFTAGGWAVPRVNDEVQSVLADRVAEGGGMRLLLGRRSYDDMLAYWNTQDSPFRDGLNRAQKFVASRNAEASLPWPNSTLLTGDIPEAVRSLKADGGPDLCVMGSSELVHALLEHRLVDELLLFIHPVLLGRGRRLFPTSRGRTSWTTLASRPTATGVIIAHFRSADEH
jgi:dihydrofolate reductase